jgi:formamidopyrimidine-DNA glycosylase
MPELPEVECLTRAVRRIVKGACLVEARFLRRSLRLPIPVTEFRKLLEGELILDVMRRSKYMLLKTKKGYGIFHLGMTGNMLNLESAEPKILHTHAIFKIIDTKERISYLHFIDPRRFGIISCVAGESFSQHDYFVGLGPEPLKTKTLGEHLFAKSRGKKQPIKCFLMDAHIVVGVGNIYASESLFRAGIDPRRPAKSVSRLGYEVLGRHIQATLKEAIKAGGTTFRDFKNSDGNPGYFRLSLNVYGRTGEPCLTCGRKIRQVRQAGRATYFCAFCQT